MDWKQKDKYHIEAVTPAGVYRVSKSLLHGVPIYSAWPPPPRTASDDAPYRWQDHVIRAIGHYDTADEAKAACAAHAQKRLAPPRPAG